MYSKIKRLRAGGARRSDREISADTGIVGHLSIATVGHVKEMKLHGAGDDARRAPLIPVLFEPKIEAMHGNRQLFSGLERKGNQADPNGCVVLQEWAIEVMAWPPSEVADTPHRPPP